MVREQLGCTVLCVLRLGSNVRIDQGINFLSHVVRSTLSQVSVFPTRLSLSEKHLRYIWHRLTIESHRSMTQFPCQNPVTRSKYKLPLLPFSSSPKGLQRVNTFERCLTQKCYHCFHSPSVGECRKMSEANLLPLLPFRSIGSSKVMS